MIRSDKSATAVLLAALVLAVDLTSKALLWGADASALIDPTTNPGMALGYVLPPEPALFAFGWTAFLAVGWWMLRQALRLGIQLWPIGLAVGGSAGNLIERTLFGEVRDFLVVGPIVMNIADVALTIGVVAFVILVASASPLPNGGPVFAGRPSRQKGSLPTGPDG